MNFKRYLVVAFALLLGATAAFGQGFQVGNIAGTVNDKTGAVLPGVTVEATSVARGTTRVEVTDQEGQFRFVQLPIGEYTVTATLAGFETGVVPGNRIDINKTTNVTITLSLGGVSEAIVVTGEAPVVDETNSAVDTTIPEETFQKLPMGRSYQTLAAGAPGVTGGSNPNVNGALSSSNVYLFDGVDTTDTTTGTFGANINFEAIQEAQVLTAAASAEYGRATGMILNVVTKSGSNEFAGSAKVIMDNDDWDGQNKTKHPLTGASFARTKNDVRNDRYSATLGGPVLRDRIWFFGAYETIEGSNGPFQLPVSLDNYTYTTDLTLENYRLTGQITPTQSLWVKFDNDPFTGILRNYGAPAEVEALTAQDQGGERWAAQYTGIIGSNIAFELMYGKNDNIITVAPSHQSDLTGGAVHYDLSTGRFFNGSYFDGFVERPREQWIGAVSYFTEFGGNAHELKAGVDFQEMASSNLFGPQNGQWYLDHSFDHVNRTFEPYLRRDFVVEPSTSEGEITSLYLLDKFEVGDRLFFNLGARFEDQTGSSDIGASTVDTSTFSPRLSGSYDLFATGKTLLRASYGRYYQSIIQDYSDNFGQNAQYALYDQYIWDEEAQDWVFLNSRGAGESIYTPNPNLDPTYLDEYTIGVQHELGNRFGVGARYIVREWDDLQDDLYGYDANGDFGVEFINSSIATREYQGLQFTLEKRFSSNWSAVANYTISETKGNHFSTYAGSLHDYETSMCEVYDDNVGVVPCSDVLSADRLYGNPSTDQDQANLLATYARPIGPLNFALGTVVSWSEGERFARTGTAEVLDPDGEATGETYSYYYEDPGARQLGSIWRGDLSLDLTYPIMNLVEVGFKAEVFNVTDNQKQDEVTDSSWCSDNGAQCQGWQEEFGLGLTRGAYQAPRSYRATVLVRF